MSQLPENLQNANVGDNVSLFDGWCHTKGIIVHADHDRVITVTRRRIRMRNYLDYVLWESPFPSISQMVRGKTHTEEKLQTAWDKAFPAQAPRDCLNCNQSFRPTWHGPGSAIHCPKCNPPHQMSSKPHCHYCGQPTDNTQNNFFGAAVCTECH